MNDLGFVLYDCVQNQCDEFERDSKSSYYKSDRERQGIYFC